MTNYLRSQNLLNKFSFRTGQKFRHIDVNDTECESKIEQFRNVFYATLKAEFEEDDDLADDADCLVDHLKKSHMAEVSLKKMVYENTRKLSMRKRKKALKAIDYAIEKKTEIAVKVCTFNEVFGEVFDALYENRNVSGSSEESDNPEEDYCERKYIVDRNFINTTLYDVNINPLNISVSNLNCSEIVENSLIEAVNELRNQFEDELERPSRRAMKCVTKVIRTGNFFENNVRIAMLGELGISEERKSEERRQYIETMKEIYENILKC